MRYRLTYSVAEVAEPTTFRVVVTVPDDDNWNSAKNSLERWCAGDGMAHRGTVISGGNDFTCDLTFQPGGTSDAVPYDLDISAFGYSVSLNPAIRIDGMAAPLDVPGYTILSVPRYDATLHPLQVHSVNPQWTFATRGGVSGMISTHRLTLVPLNFSPAYSADKGKPRNVQAAIELDYTNYPAGTRLTGNGLTEIRDRVLSGFVTQPSHQSTPVNIEVFVPLSGMPADGGELVARISRADIVVTGPSIPVQENLGGLPQPGMDKPRDCDTSGECRLLDSGKGRTAPNNDWTITRILTAPTVGLLSKRIIPDSSAPAHWYDGLLVKTEAPLWSVIGIERQAWRGDVLICDNWANLSNTDAYEAPQYWDVDRKPILWVWDNAANKYVRDTSSMRLEFAAPGGGSRNLNDCGTVGDSTGWTDTPTTEHDVVRIHLEDINLATSAGAAVQIYLPFKTYESYLYPNLDFAARYVNDQLHVS